MLAARGLAAPDLIGFLGSFRLPLKAFFADLGVAEPDLDEAESEWNEKMGSERAVPMPGISEMLEALGEAGISVGVVSAADADVVQREIRALGLEGRFAFVVGSASPKRRVLSRLAEVYGAGRVAYVGDTEHDVEEAMEAGVAAIGFGSGYRPEGALAAAGAESVISDLRDMPGLLTERFVT